MKMSGARRVIFDCASHRADRRCFRGSSLGGLAGQGWGALAMSGRLANANHVVPRGRCGCNAHARHQGQAGLASPSCMRCMAGWRRLRGQLQPSRGGRGSARPGRPLTHMDFPTPSLRRFTLPGAGFLAVQRRKAGVAHQRGARARARPARFAACAQDFQDPTLRLRWRRARGMRLGPRAVGRVPARLERACRGAALLAPSGVRRPLRVPRLPCLCARDIALAAELRGVCAGLAPSGARAGATLIFQISTTQCWGIGQSTAALSGRA